MATASFPGVLLARSDTTLAISISEQPDRERGGVRSQCHDECVCVCVCVYLLRRRCVAPSQSETTHTEHHAASARLRQESAESLLAGRPCTPHLRGGGSKVKLRDTLPPTGLTSICKSDKLCQRSFKQNASRSDERTHGDSREVDEQVLSNHHLLDQLTVTQLHQLGVVEGGGDLPS